MEDNFKQLRLSTDGLSSLYRDNLVFIADSPPVSSRKKATQAEKKSTSLSPQGQNRKNITLIINQADAGSPDPDTLIFISRMLEACKLKMDDIALVNAAQQAITLQQLKSELNPSAVLLFGVSPDHIGLPIIFPEYKLQEFDKTTYLLVPDLSLLNQDNDSGKLLKSKLWACLRQLFKL